MDDLDLFLRGLFTPAGIEASRRLLRDSAPKVEEMVRKSLADEFAGKPMPAIKSCGDPDARLRPMRAAVRGCFP